MTATDDDVVQYLYETDPFVGMDPIVASNFPVEPPEEWFESPGLDRPTPMTVTADGRVYGHIAPWNCRHIGLPGHVKPPKSRSKYAFFNKGLLRTASGKDVTVGQLTLAGGHAPLHADASRAIEHYDDTRSAAADIHIGEDRHGIWAAGAVRPDIDPIKFRALRASVPSGDWRPINGALELIAVCQVNSGGFPQARAAIAASSGEVLALVAAGAQHMYNLKFEDAHSEYGSRLADLETRVRSAHRDALRARMRA